MNNDLISREALKDKVADLYTEGEEATEGDKVINNVIDIIDNAPTVCGNNPKWCESCVSKGKCASTRPQGKWKVDGALIACNKCGRILLKASKLYNFCPNCGADMRGGGENE